MSHYKVIDCKDGHITYQRIEDENNEIISNDDNKNVETDKIPIFVDGVKIFDDIKDLYNFEV